MVYITDSRGEQIAKRFVGALPIGNSTVGWRLSLQLYQTTILLIGIHRRAGACSCRCLRYQRCGWSKPQPYDHTNLRFLNGTHINPKLQKKPELSAFAGSFLFVYCVQKNPIKKFLQLDFFKKRVHFLDILFKNMQKNHNFFCNIVDKIYKKCYYKL